MELQDELKHKVLNACQFTLYPALENSECHFQVNERVYVSKSHGKTRKSGKLFAAGTVIAERCNTKSDQFYNRYKVQYDDGSCYHVKPSRLISAKYYISGVASDASRKLNVVACAETKDYRRFAQTQVLKHDRVIEIGCDFGITTHFLSTCCHKAIGIDKSATHVQMAREKYPHLQFETIDLFEQTQTFLDLAKEHQVTKVLVDINGNRALEAVMRAIDVLATSTDLPLDTVIVKSVELRHFLIQHRQFLT